MSMLTHPVSRGQAARRGLLAAVLGDVLVAWPHITIGTVVVLFAVYSVADAVTVARRAFMPGLTGGDRALLGIRAVIEVGAAVTAVVWPGITASALTVVVGLYAITAGGLELAGYGLLAKYGVRASGWLIAGGLASIGRRPAARLLARHRRRDARGGLRRVPRRLRRDRGPRRPRDSARRARRRLIAHRPSPERTPCSDMP
jgi:uncharacterized membrane protein HdeD (DUF308 family)